MSILTKFDFRRFSLLLSIVASIVFAHRTYAAPFPGLLFEVLAVTAEDGAPITLIHLLADPTQPSPSKVILLEPGLMESAETMESLARHFMKRGYEVLIGQDRLVGARAAVSGAGPENELREVLLYDTTAHLRETLRIAGGREVHVCGHSKGGIQLMALFSDPRRSEEFQSSVVGASLLTAPPDTQDLPRWIKRTSGFISPFLELAHGLRKETLNPHRALFDLTLNLKKHRRLPVRVGAYVLEQTAIGVTSLLLDGILLRRELYTKGGLRRSLRQKISTFPLGLLRGLARSVAAGRFIDEDGNPLIDAKNLKIPLLVLAAEDDPLAPLEGQMRLLGRATHPGNQFVYLLSTGHIDIAMADLLPESVYESIVGFHDSLGHEPLSARKPLVIRPQTNDVRICEDLLVIQGV